MDDIHDSTVDASRMLVFQADPIRHSVLETAEHSLVSHSGVVECRKAHQRHAGAVLLALSENLGSHSAVSHAPNLIPCRVDSKNPLYLVQMHLNGLVRVHLVRALMSMTSIHARRTVMYMIEVPMLGREALREGLGPSASWGS